MKTAKGSELIFISNIGRDGKTITDVSEINMNHLNNTEFVLASLSFTQKTFIASEHNSYTVRLKKSN